MINVLITGASSEIGTAIVNKLITKDYVDTLFLHYNTNRPFFMSEKKVVYLRENFSCLTKSDLVYKVLSFVDRIDVLINCAGVISDMAYDNLSPSEFDRVIHINAKIPYILTKETFNEMKKYGGKIINISSNVTKYGMGRNNSIVYAASKAMMDILTIGLASIGAEYNVLVNSVSPGCINTNLQRCRSDLLNRISMIPLKRIGEPEDVANMVEYLVSDKGNFITGQIIGVTGGE